MLSHMCLKFKTQGLKLNGLPKAIRSSISYHLFYPIAQKAYVFHGVSHEFLFQLVAEMEAEYFPPKEDVILQNEAPKDLYVLVSGTADLIRNVEGHDKVIGKAAAGDVFGEIGILCHRPQPFTVRTAELAQILRLNRTSLMNSIKAKMEDGRIIMSNLSMKLQGPESIASDCQNTDPQLILGKWLDQRPNEGLFSKAGCQDNSIEHPSIYEARNVGFQESVTKEKSGMKKCPNLADVNSTVEDGQTAVHPAASKGHIEMVKILLEGGASVNKPDARGGTPKALAEHPGNKSIYDLLLNYENKRILHEHKIDFIEPETMDDSMHGQSTDKENSGSNLFNSSEKASTNFTSCISSCLSDREVRNLSKRVTIHMQFQDRSIPQRRQGKLIILPDSIEELLRIAGQKFGGYKFTRVINAENAEIDDIDVIRDGDHLFLLQNDSDNSDSNMTEETSSGFYVEKQMA